MIRVKDVLKADRMQHASEPILKEEETQHEDEYSDQGLIRVQNGLIITSKKDPTPMGAIQWNANEHKHRIQRLTNL